MEIFVYLPQFRFFIWRLILKLCGTSFQRQFKSQNALLVEVKYLDANQVLHPYQISSGFQIMPMNVSYYTWKTSVQLHGYQNSGDRQKWS